MALMALSILIPMQTPCSFHLIVLRQHYCKSPQTGPPWLVWPLLQTHAQESLLCSQWFSGTPGRVQGSDFKSSTLTFIIIAFSMNPCLAKLIGTFSSYFLPHTFKFIVLILSHLTTILPIMHLIFFCFYYFFQIFSHKGVKSSWKKY